MAAANPGGSLLCRHYEEIDIARVSGIAVKADGMAANDKEFNSVRVQ
jgi:hypothetical protein